MKFNLLQIPHLVSVHRWEGARKRNLNRFKRFYYCDNKSSKETHCSCPNYNGELSRGREADLPPRRPSPTLLRPRFHLTIQLSKRASSSLRIRTSNRRRASLNENLTEERASKSPDRILNSIPTPLLPDFLRKTRRYTKNEATV